MFLNIKRKNMSIFNLNKLTKQESTKVLKTMSGFLGSGETAITSLVFAGETFGGKIKKVADKIEDDYSHNSIPLRESLEAYGILSQEEATILGNKDTNTYEAINNIIKLREYGDKYESIIISGIYSTILLAFATFISIFYFSKTIKDYLVELKESMVTDPSVGADLSFIPSYLNDPSILLIYSGVLAFLLITVPTLYSYFYKNNRKVIYKIFKKKPYDDIPRLFHIMTGMKFSGSKNTIQVFESLKDNKEYTGLSVMFQELEDAVIAHDPYYEIFEKYGFPKDITIMIQSKEKTELWDGIEELIKYATNKAQEEFIKMKKAWSTASMFLPWIIPSYYMFSLSVALYEASKATY